jgi:hypothetical protein
LVQVSERLQADEIAGTKVDADALVRVSSEARRLLATIRAKGAKNRPVGPDLQSYLAQEYPKTDTGPADDEPEPPAGPPIP